MTSIRRVKFVDLGHGSPEWVTSPLYFVTICTQEKGRNQLCTDGAKDIIRSIQSYHENQRWYCELAVLMPDHVHLLVTFGNLAD